MAKVAALVLGAGRGERLGHALPKAFVPLAGMTLIERSIRALDESGAVGLILPVLAQSEIARFKALGLGDIKALASPVVGGAERQDSVRAGLAALPKETEWVAVHDAARCMVSPGDIERVVAAAQRDGAAILGAPCPDTIKLVCEQGRIRQTPDRAQCWIAQTPQVGRRDWLEEASAQAFQAKRLGTDDAQLLEWAGHSVQMIQSAHPNPKITRPEDLLAAKVMLDQQEMGEASAAEVSR